MDANQTDLILAGHRNDHFEPDSIPRDDPNLVDRLLVKSLALIRESADTPMSISATRSGTVASEMDDEGGSDLNQDLHVEAIYRLTEALVLSEQRMRRRIDLLSEVVFETDNQGRLIFLNKAWQKTLGLEVQVSLGKSLSEFLVPEDRARLAGLTRQGSADEDQGVQARFRMRRGDASIAWVEISVAPVEGGGLTGAIRDITQQKLIQDDIEKLSIVASSTDNIVIITDADGRTEWVNRAFTERTGYALEEILGRKPGRLLQGPETNPDAVQRIRYALERSQPIQEELLNYAKCGEPYWVSVQITPVRDTDGVATRFISVQSDVTGRKLHEREILRQKEALEDRVLSRTAELALAKEQAESAALAKSAFLANMSHEIRSPLNAIIGFSHLCLQTPLEEKQREFVTKAGQAARNLVRIVDDVLELTKIEAGGLFLEMRRFAFDGVAANVDAIVGPLARAKGLEFSIVRGADIPSHLVGDAQRLEQVLINLCGHAVQFTSTGSVLVDVAVESESPKTLELKVRVKDTGMGLTREQLSHLFSAFSQPESAKRLHFGGAGLGPVISKHLIEKMGGQISVQSEPGIGSVLSFTVRFDRYESVTARDAATDSNKQEGLDITGWRKDLQGARVLVAEDNDFNQLVVREMLGLVGVEVTMAANGREVMDILARAQPKTFDLVLMDVHMPVMDGLDATRLIRQTQGWADLVIVSMTANSTLEDRQSCASAGMDDFVTKPIEAALLYGTIRKWLSRMQPQEDARESTARVCQDLAVARAPQIQLARISKLASQDPTMATRLLQVFLESTEVAVGEMRKALAIEEFDTLRQLGHKLKASSATMGCKEFALWCSALEAAAIAGSQANCRSAVESLVSLWQEIHAKS